MPARRPDSVTVVLAARNRPDGPVAASELVSGACYTPVGGRVQRSTNSDRGHLDSMKEPALSPSCGAR